MDHHGDIQVLIAGAGPTGLTLACDLARRGVRFRIIDKAPEYFTGSRGKGVQPRSLEVFDDLGVADAVLAAGSAYPLLEGRAGAEAVWERAMHEEREPTADVPYPNPVLMPQWRTEQILRDRLAEYGVTVELGTELTEFSQDEHGVALTLAGPGGSTQVRADYLVGADGGRSFVRRALGVGFEGETLKTVRMLVGDVLVDGLNRQRWRMWMAPQAQMPSLTLCPLPGTEAFQIVVALQPDETPELSLEAVQGLVGQRTGDPNLRVRELTWLSLYQVNERMVDRYRVSRVLLAGDAAHVHSPAGGQGLNTGVQDAYNLGWKLDHVLRGAPDALLDSYEAERLPIAASVLGISSRLLRKAAAGEQDAMRRGPATQQLGLNYRGGPLSRDWPRPAESGIAAGDRAPDARCRLGGDPVRLFDLFRGPQWTVLAFGAWPELPAATAAVRLYRLAVEPGEADLVDPDGAAHRGYGVEPGERALVLVRPDGYVGLVARGEAGAEQLTSYLELVGPVAKVATSLVDISGR